MIEKSREQLAYEFLLQALRSNMIIFSSKFSIENAFKLADTFIEMQKLPPGNYNVRK